MKNKKTHHLGVRISPDKFAQIKVLADSRNLPVSLWVRTLLNEYLAKGHAGGVRLP